MNISTDDLIHILTQQRNAALDEIARMGAIIKALERELKGEPASGSRPNPDF